MKKILKAAGIGFLAALALFLVPFLFRFILGVALIGLIARMILGKRRNRRGFGGPRFGNQHYAWGGNSSVPVDGSWHHNNRQQQGGAEQKINLR